MAPPADAPLALTFPGSSNLVGARFDEATGEIEVDFKNGSTWKYKNFTADLAKEFGEAKSAGSWFDANIKKQAAKYPGVEVKAKPAAAPPTAAPVAVAPAPVAPVDLAVNYQDSHESVQLAAKSAYEAYIKNSGSKAWDGKPCPTWDKLGVPVQSHWCAAVLDTMGRAGIDGVERQGLVVQVEMLRRTARHAEEAAANKLEGEVKKRSAMLGTECDDLRAKVAALEAKLRTRPGFAPWRTEG